MSKHLIDFSIFLCYTLQDHKELEAMAQTTAEFLIENKVKAMTTRRDPNAAAPSSA